MCALKPPAVLGAIEREICGCRACPRLVEWRERAAREPRASFRGETYWARPVPGFGDPHASIAVVGLAPAANGGNRTGRVFTGDRSGDWLFRSLYRAGLANQPTSTDRDDGLRLQGVWVTAVVKCAPPGNKPANDERDRCTGYLVRELAALSSVRVMIALGRFAYDTCWRLQGVGKKPAFAHGRSVTLKDGKALVCSYHPSQQNTFTGRLTEEMLDSVTREAVSLAAGGASLSTEHR